MKTKMVLKKFKNGKISIENAQMMICHPNTRKCKTHFVKMKIRTKKLGVDIFLRLLLILPVPILFVRTIIRRFAKQYGIDAELAYLLIRSGRIKIDVVSKNGEKVKIKTF